MPRRILFVCLGNICRSPAAEGVMRVRLPGYEYDSAGTSGWHVGEPPYPPMRRAAAARGYPIDDLRARQFSPGDFDAFDLIVTMDDHNLAAVEAMRPQGSDTRVLRCVDFLTAPVSDHVPDPYYTGDFETVLDMLEDATPGLELAMKQAETGGVLSKTKSGRS